RRYDSSPHALMIRRAIAEINDLPIGYPDPRDETVLFLRKARIEIERPGDIFCRHALEKISNRVDCHPTRHIAGLMATHAVGNDEQVILGDHNKAIFV